MAINLVKGQRLELDSGLSKLKVEMGWALSENARYDLDASTFLLGESGQVENEYDFVFYGSPNKTTVDGVERPCSVDMSVLGPVDDLGDDDDFSDTVSKV
jgi:tellurium resistance protein TerD